MANQHDKHHALRVPSPVLRSSQTTASITLTSDEVGRLQVHNVTFQEIEKLLRSGAKLIDHGVSPRCDEASASRVIVYQRVSSVSHEDNA